MAHGNYNKEEKTLKLTDRNYSIFGNLDIQTPRLARRNRRRPPDNVR